MAFRVFSRIGRSGVVRRFASVSVRPESLSDGPKLLWIHPTRILRDSIFSKASFQRFGFSSSASPQSSHKEASQAATSDNAPDDVAESENRADGDKFTVDPTTEETADDADSEVDLSKDELIKLVAEKEELLNLKHKEIEQMKDKVLRSYAETENVIGRTKREAENSKKFAIQAFAKSLLNVSDNLGRAQSVVKESFSKIDVSNDSAGAVPLLKTLLDGVEMTEKQLGEVFKKFGVEKYDPLNENFDPHRHNAVFQIPDASKPAGTVAVVLKSGYMLYDRVLRPAEVGVTQDSNEDS